MQIFDHSLNTSNAKKEHYKNSHPTILKLEYRIEEMEL